MIDLPEPLVSYETDCRTLDSFMLNVERLMSSELVALYGPEIIGSALMLWCRAWKQVPAASLPNDDRVLAAFAKMPLKAFLKVRDQVMHGFELCSDARYYHRVLADVANRALRDRQIEINRKKQRVRAFPSEWPLYRAAVFRRDGYQCVYCGDYTEPLECDHVIPVSRGGETSMENLVTACRPCNREKGAKTPAEWRQ